MALRIVHGWTLAFAVSIALAGCASSAPPPSPPAPTVAAVAPAPQLVSATDSGKYPLKVCVVSGEKLDASRLVYKYEGQEVQFCCTHCVDDFKKNPARYMAKVQEASQHPAQ